MKNVTNCVYSMVPCILQFPMLVNKTVDKVLESIAFRFRR